MRFWTRHLPALTCSLALLLLGSAARADLALDLSTGGFTSNCGSCGTTGTTYGWSFTANSAITVTGLGVWDADGDGLGSSTQVGLFTAAGALLASATVGDTDLRVASASAAGDWLTAAIGPLTLAAGNYLIGQVFTDFLPTAATDAAYTNDPRITVTGGAASGLGDTGLAAPLDGLPFIAFGPTLLVVPEPGSAWLLALAGLALVAARRHVGR